MKMKHYALKLGLLIQGLLPSSSNLFDFSVKRISRFKNIPLFSYCFAVCFTATTFKIASAQNIKALVTPPCIIESWKGLPELKLIGENEHGGISENIFRKKTIESALAGEILLGLEPHYAEQTTGQTFKDDTFPFFWDTDFTKAGTVYGIESVASRSFSNLVLSYTSSMFAISILQFEETGTTKSKERDIKTLLSNLLNEDGTIRLSALFVNEIDSGIEPLSSQLYENFLKNPPKEFRKDEIIYMSERIEYPDNNASFSLENAKTQARFFEHLIKRFIEQYDGSSTQLPKYILYQLAKKLFELKPIEAKELSRIRNYTSVYLRDISFTYNILKVYCQGIKKNKPVSIIVGSAHLAGLSNHLRQFIPSEKVSTFKPTKLGAYNSRLLKDLKKDNSASPQ